MPLCFCIMTFLSALRSSFHHGLDLAPGLFIGILAFTALVIASVRSEAALSSRAVISVSPSKILCWSFQLGSRLLNSFELRVLLPAIYDCKEVAKRSQLASCALKQDVCKGLSTIINFVPGIEKRTP